MDAIPVSVDAKSGDESEIAESRVTAKNNTRHRVFIHSLMCCWRKPPVAMQGRAGGNFYERMSADVLLDSAKYLPGKASAEGAATTW
jgi:hypothetical protein